MRSSRQRAQHLKWRYVERRRRSGDPGPVRPIVGRQTTAFTRHLFLARKNREGHTFIFPHRGGEADGKYVALCGRTTDRIRHSQWGLITQQYPTTECADCRAILSGVES